MTITWLGHSCFLLNSGGFRLLLDPYHSVRGLADAAAEADAVFCSHGHFDHAYLDQVTCTAGKASPFTVEEVQTFHDGQGGKLRGENTVRRFTAEGISVVHLGDLGHQLTGGQIAALTPCDVLLLPVGGTYTLDPAGARAVTEALGPRIVIPMHYRRGSWGFTELAEVEDFLSLCPGETVNICPGSTLTVDRDTPPQIAVLSPKNDNNS